MQERGHDGDSEPCLGGGQERLWRPWQVREAGFALGQTACSPQTPTLYAITLGRRPTGISRLPRALLAGVHAEKVPWGLAELEGGSDARPLWVSRLPRAGLPGHVSGKQGHSLSGY